MGVELGAPAPPGAEHVLDDGALALVARLHDELDATRRELLAKRAERQAELDAGGTLDFLAATKDIRDGDWTVSPPPAAYTDRRVEITGPTSAKMVINALNSGARGFMADFEDANSPTWANMVEGQANLMAAVRGTLEVDSPDGREYRLDEERATLLVRPRGWHLTERHVTVAGDPVAGGLFDFALYAHHNAHELLKRGSGPFLYLPKLESHLEARLWNDALTIAEEALGLDSGAIRATVLIETLPAAFEMDEILYELRDHSAGLNAGRWDYIFSAIKRLRSRAECVLPDRAQVTMTVPFMRAYTELLVKTCHRRGTHAMGGMSAVIPSRTDSAAAERAKEAVGADKRRESAAGFDGSWVAHPDSVEAALAEFDAVLGERPNQIDRLRDDVDVSAAELLDIASTPGEITEAGLRANVSIGIAYIDSWLLGNGAAALNGLMEDAATAEISRSQVWQWIHHAAQLDDGRTVTAELVREMVASEPEGPARDVFEQVALADELVEFLTLPAYERLAG
jgi:malate synthase